MHWSASSWSELVFLPSLLPPSPMRLTVHGDLTALDPQADPAVRSSALPRKSRETGKRKELLLSFRIKPENETHSFDVSFCVALTSWFKFPCASTPLTLPSPKAMKTNPAERSIAASLMVVG